MRYVAGNLDAIYLLIVVFFDTQIVPFREMWVFEPHTQSGLMRLEMTRAKKCPGHETGASNA
jgi:hypothetical protein